MKTKWYLWAVNDDPRTNDYLVGVIGQQEMEYLHTKKLCADDTRRNLFECPRGYADVRSAVAAVSQQNLKLEVFKEDASGVLVRFDLWKNGARKALKIARCVKRIRGGNFNG